MIISSRSVLSLTANKDIDSLLVDMIDLGLAESRVKILVSNIYSYITGFEDQDLYNITFPTLDKKIGEISHYQILKSLEDNNCIFIGPRVNENLIKIYYSHINRVFLNIIIYHIKLNLERFISLFALSYVAKIRVQLFIDNVLIYEKFN